MRNSLAVSPDRPSSAPARVEAAVPRPSTGPGRTILLAIPSGHNVANLLRSRFLPSVLAQNVRVVIVSPFATDPTFVKEFSSDGVEIETLPPWQPSPAEWFVDSVLSEAFLLRSRLAAVRLQRDRARLLDPWPGRSTMTAIKAVVSRLPVSRQTWFRVARGLSHAPPLDGMFARHRPALLVTSSAGFFTAEVPLIYAAKRHGVPQLGIDLGWDNLASKYHTILPVDRLAVWNDDMRQDAVRYHGFEPSDVSVVGPVQFDHYFEDLQLPAREAFLAATGVAQGRALVTVATAPHTVYPSTPWLIDIVLNAIAGDRLGRPVHLLVRVHPRDDLAQYQRFEGRPHVTIEKPVAHLVGTPGTPQFDQFSATRADRRHLAATLAYSDVLVNFASTTTIEACVFDTPVINIGFDEKTGLPPALSIRRYFSFEHYQPVVESGAATITSSPEALVEGLRAYLADRSRDQKARRELAARLCPFRDGGAAERLSQVVVDALDEQLARRGSA